MNRVADFKYGKITLPGTGSIRDALISTGEYQDYIVRWANKFGRPSSTMLDVGSNVGCHTIPLAQLFNGSCEVHAFEPEPEAYSILSENIKLNNLSNVRIAQVGLSNETKRQAFFVTPDSGGSTLSENPQHRGGTQEKIEIDVTKLDDLHIENISFIKVDIQFWEYYFLDGALGTLAKNRPALVLELPVRNKQEERGAEKCIKLLDSIDHCPVERNGKDVLFMWKGSFE